MKKAYQIDSIKQPSDLRSEFQHAVIAAARIAGWPALSGAALVAQFKGRAGRSTLYRWLKEIVGSPLDRTTAEMIRDASTGGRAEVESVAGEVRAKLALALPRVPTLGECVAATTPLPIMENLAACLAAAQDVMGRSRDAAGAVRNSKMLLSASEHLRRSLETAVKLQEAISDGLQIEQFHQTIMEEIEKIDPAVAGRIATRLLEVNSAWGGQNNAEKTRQ